MSDDFKFTRDFRSIMWKETLWYNALRALCAGLVWSVLLLLSGKAIGEAAQMFVGYPLMYFLFLLPLGMISSWLAGIPFVGLFALFLSFLVAVGDPLVCLIHSIKPEWVPMENPPLFSLRIAYYVLNPLPPGSVG